MIIDYETGSYYCFGCGKTGDALTFVKTIEPGLDDLEACFKLVKILKSKKTREIRSRDIIIREKADSKDALAMAHDYYYGLKTIDWKQEQLPIKQYMMKRGFTPDILNKAKAKFTYNTSYPIIFPMLDNGEFKGWVCRTDLKRIEKKRKYLYNEGFSRATTLVGYYKGPQPVVVVEGYMDYLKLRQFGLKRVVAILGWKMTPYQIEKLKSEGITTVISALDTDECGQKGSAFLQKHFNVVRFRFPKGCKDAGDLTPATFRRCYRLTKQDFNKFRRKAK